MDNWNGQRGMVGTPDHPHRGFETVTYSCGEINAVQKDSVKNPRHVTKGRIGAVDDCWIRLNGHHA